MRRALSPRGASTFTTSAPRSPSTWVQSGPETTVVKSNTRMPASGPRGAAPISTFMATNYSPNRAISAPMIANCEKEPPGCVPITALYAGLLALIAIALGAVIGPLRVRTGISILHGDNMELATRDPAPRATSPSRCRSR